MGRWIRYNSVLESIKRINVQKKDVFMPRARKMKQYVFSRQLFVPGSSEARAGWLNTYRRTCSEGTFLLETLDTF